jgi:hypothetical protein
MFQTRVLEKITTHILFSIKFFPKNRTVCEIMWRNMVEPDRSQMIDNIIWRMRFACWITKATDTHSEYVILIAFLRQWIRERAFMLRYTCVASLARY